MVDPDQVDLDVVLRDLPPHHAALLNKFGEWPVGRAPQCIEPETASIARGVAWLTAW